MKITVIGGGSTYTPELVNGFLARTDRLPITELWLMDIDKERLDIVGGFAQRMVKAKGEPFKVVLSLNQREAIAGASYIITQLRVGMMPARRGDEYLGRRHGLIGQETTGVGGMAKALRTIPIILDIAKDVREVAPGALLANFTNPAGLVTEALNRHASDVPAVGVCNVGITTKMEILEELEKLTGQKVADERAVLKTLGLNHLTWHYGFTVDGEEMWPQIFPAFVEMIKQEEEPEWDIRTLESLGMMPNYYLQYFYYTEQKTQSTGQVAAFSRRGSHGDREGFAAGICRSRLDRASRRPDEAWRRLLLDPSYSTDQLALQRSRPNPHRQRAQQRRCVRLACGLGTGDACQGRQGWYPTPACGAVAPHLLRTDCLGQDVRDSLRPGGCAWRQERRLSGAAGTSAGAKRGQGAGRAG